MKTITLTDEQFELLTDALFFTERHIKDYDETHIDFGNLYGGIGNLSLVVAKQDK